MGLFARLITTLLLAVFAPQVAILAPATSIHLDETLKVTKTFSTPRGPTLQNERTAAHEEDFDLADLIDLDTFETVSTVSIVPFDLATAPLLVDANAEFIVPRSVVDYPGIYFDLPPPRA